MKKIISASMIAIINIIICLDVLALELQIKELNKRLEIYEIKKVDVINEFNGSPVEFYIKHSNIGEQEEIIEEKIVEEENAVEEINIVEEIIEPVQTVPQAPLYDVNPTIENRDLTLAKEIAAFAVQFEGNPYVYGGTSLTNGADCSGFIQSVYLNFGISLSRSAYSQSFDGYGISINDISEGDIIAFGYDGMVSHVGLYIGNGKIIHASTPEGGIRIDNMYIMPIITVRRIIN